MSTQFAPTGSQRTYYEKVFVVNNNAATASACTLRMIPSTFFGLNWPIGTEDTMARRRGNRAGQGEDWQFGLSEIRVAEHTRRLAHLLRNWQVRCNAGATLLLAP